MSTSRPPYPNQARFDLLEALPLHIFNNLTLTSISNPHSPTPTAHATVTTLARHLTPREPATLNGGITTSVLDSVCLFAVTPTLAPGEESVTIASSFQLIGGVAGVGKVVEFEGRVVKRGKRVVFCESVASCEGVVIARGMLTKSVVVTREGRERKL